MTVSTATKINKGIMPTGSAPADQASVCHDELDSFCDEVLLQGEEYEVVENIAGFYLTLNEWFINDVIKGQV